MKKIHFFLAAFLTLTSVSVNAQQLVSSTLLGAFNPTQVDSIYQSIGLPVFLAPITYGIEVHKLVFETSDAQGNTIIGSGAIFFPVDPTGTVCFPRMSYQHGTVLRKTDVPSNLDDGSLLSGVSSATSGYVVTAPDFHGLGDGPGFPTYVHAKTEAFAVIDLLRAGEEFCATKGVNINDQLFLVGYSHGGHATMAAHREIAEFHSNEFTVTASAPLSGPYDISGVMADVMTGPATYNQPGYAPYVVLGYQEAYGNIFNNLSDVFAAPYDSIVGVMYDGTNSLGAINPLLPSVPRDMFDSTWLDGFINDPQNPLRIAVEDNDLYNWKPEDPMRILYCLADELVPAQNSLVAYNAFIAAGSTTVSAFDVNSNGTHSSCALPAILGAKAWFDSLAVDTCPPVAPVGIRENIAPQFALFPNPAKEQVTVEFANPDHAKYQVSILDISGRVRKQAATTTDAFLLDIELLPPGMYLLKVDGPTSYLKRLVIQ